MSLFEIIHHEGYHPPFRPDPRCPGTVRAGCKTPIPYAALPGRLSEDARYAAARKLADQLNGEAHAHLLAARRIG